MSRPDTSISPAHAETDRIALEVLEHPRMKEKVSALRVALTDSLPWRTPDGPSTLDRALAGLAAAAINYVITEAGISDELRWVATAEREFGGGVFPNSGFGIENPDNVYRVASLHPAASYELRGHVDRSREPVEVHFEIRDCVPGTKEMSAEAGLQLSTLALDEVDIDGEGNFTISIEPGGPIGRNKLSSSVDANAHFIIRDLLDDWGHELPTRLDLVRVDDNPVDPPKNVEEIVDETVALLDLTAGFWVDYFTHFSYPRTGNGLGAPRVRPGGRGASTGGWFSLASDEAVVITLDPLSARSMGIQLSDPWGLAYEYRDRTSSLNGSQAVPNVDGTFTFVISTQDPGVPNWLDPEGRTSGLIAVRWQAFEKEPSPDGVVDCRQVKLECLAAHLPEGTPTMSPEQRAEQRQARSAQYFRRYPLTD